MHKISITVLVQIMHARKGRRGGHEERTNKKLENLLNRRL
jgi:hypothetical protein